MIENAKTLLTTKLGPWIHTRNSPEKVAQNVIRLISGFFTGFFFFGFPCIRNISSFQITNHYLLFTSFWFRFGFLFWVSSCFGCSVCPGAPWPLVDVAFPFVSYLHPLCSMPGSPAVGSFCLGSHLFGAPWLSFCHQNPTFT
jgi:hypothetical protein